MASNRWRGSSGVDSSRDFQLMFRRHLTCRSAEEAQAVLARFRLELSDARLQDSQRQILAEQVELSLQQFITQASADYTRRISVERSFAGDGYNVSIAAANYSNSWLHRLKSFLTGRTS